MATAAQPEDRAVSELLRTAVDEARDLVRAEVALAKDEVSTEAKYAGASLFLLVFGVAMAAVAVMGLVIGLLVASGASTATVALLFAAITAGFAVIAFISARWLMPKRVLQQTRTRIEADVLELKERLQ